MSEEYIDFGPVLNPDGSPTEFTKGMFGLPEKPYESCVRPLDEINWKPIKGSLASVGLVLIDAFSMAAGAGHVIISFHPWKNVYNTHRTEYDYCGVCYGHYNFDTYEAARQDALERVK